MYLPGSMHFARFAHFPTKLNYSILMRRFKKKKNRFLFFRSTLKPTATLFRGNEIFHSRYSFSALKNFPPHLSKDHFTAEC